MSFPATWENVEINVLCLDEELDPAGLFASGDDTADAELVAKIRADREWNPWAWCCVLVRVTHDEEVEDVYLGACSYKDENEFRECGYFKDMVDEALARFNAVPPVYVPQRNAFLEDLL